MMCPICNGTGIMVGEKVTPQGSIPERGCEHCKGTGEVEEVKTGKQQIRVYKYWSHSTHMDIT